MAANNGECQKLNKTISEICGVIKELKTFYDDTQTPITDDNPLLHRFLIKTEYLFQLDFQGKNSLLGTKRSYWDFFCKCLTGKRNTHDGVRFVKGISEIQTSEGRGRAFIRFCLMHHCLADSIQQCTLNERLLKEWYGNNSPLRMESQLSSLQSSLYELNEINFELNSLDHGLDVEWPTFARTAVDGYSWRMPSRTMSVSSLNSSMSMVNDSVDRDMFTPERQTNLSKSSTLEADEDYQAVVQALMDQNSSLEKKEKAWLVEKQKLEDELVETRKSLEQAKNESLRQKETAPLKTNSVRTPEQAKHIKLLEKGLTDSHTNSCMLLNAFQTKVTTIEDKVQQLSTKFPELSSSDFGKEEILPIPAIAVKDFVEDVSSVHFGAQDLILSQKGFLDKISNLFKSNIDLGQLSVSLRTEIEETRNTSDVNKTCSCKNDVLVMTNKKMEEQILALKDAVVALKEIVAIKELEMTKLRTELHSAKLKASSEANGSEVLESAASKQIECLLAQVYSLQQEKLELSRALINAEKKYTESENMEKFRVMGDTVKQLTDKVRRSLQLLDAQGTQNSELKEKLDASLEENRILSMQMKTLNDLLQEVENKGDASNSQHEHEEGQVGENVNATQDEQEKENQINYSEKKGVGSGPDAIKVVSRTLARLSSLIAEKKELQQQLKNNKEMTATLLTRVAEQEEQLNNVTLELTETQEFIDKLRTAFSKLQTNEAILRYELREKRHLLNKLKGQLESSRSLWKKAQQKNCDSEAQWQSLRDEFDSRRKDLAECSTSGVSAQMSPDNDDVESEKDLDDECPPNTDAISTVSLSPDDSNPLLPEESDPRDRRLKFLEEQCRMLYEKILKSAKYGAALDMRLTSLHDHYGSADTEETASTPEDEQDISEEPEVEVSIAAEISAALEKENNCSSLLESEVIVHDVIDSLVVDVTTERGNAGSPQEFSLERSETPDETTTPPSVMNVTAYDKAHALPKRIEKLRKEKDDVQRKLKKVQRELKASELEGSKYKTNIELLQTQNSDLLCQLDSKNKTESESRDVEKLKHEEIMNAKDILQRRVLVIEEQLTDRTERMLEMQQELNSSQKELELTKKSLQQEISALNFELKTEMLRYNNVCKERSEQESTTKRLQECINSQEAMIAHMEAKLLVNQTERENEQAMQWQQLEELKHALTQQDDDRNKTLTCNLDEERQKSEELRVQLQQVNGCVSQLQSQIAQLETDNEQLKKHIVKVTKSKDILWKQSQFLKNDKEMLTSGLWVNSSDVTKCTGCGVEFSLLVRKHHCRLCGRVFCDSCSAHRILTASSKQRVRTCNECFVKKSNTKTDILKLYVSDSSDDDDDDDTERKTDEASSSVSSSRRNLNCDLIDSEVTDDDLPTSEEFHLITEEEITESLDSSTEPFVANMENWVLNEVWTEDYLKNLSETGEIKTLNVAARKQCAIPVYIEHPGNTLKWSFTSKAKSIDFYVLYYSSADGIPTTPGETLLRPTRCQCDVHAVNGELIPSVKGFYTFVFDNSFSKFTAKKIDLTITFEVI